MIVKIFDVVTLKLYGLTTPGNHYWKGRISTFDLLVRCNSYQLLLMLIFKFFFSQKCYFNEEANCTEPSPSVRLPCPLTSFMLASHHSDLDLNQAYLKHGARPWTGGRGLRDRDLPRGLRKDRRGFAEGHPAILDEAEKLKIRMSEIRED